MAKLEIYAECKICGATLDIEMLHDNIMSVTPCEECMNDARREERMTREETQSCE